MLKALHIRVNIINFINKCVMEEHDDLFMAVNNRHTAVVNDLIKTIDGINNMT